MERNVSEVKLVRRVEIRLSADLYEAALEIAKQLGGLSINAVANMAMASYVRNWAAPWKRKGKPGQTERKSAEELVWPSGWPKTEACPAQCTRGEHDPAEHDVKTLGGNRVMMAFLDAGLPNPYVA